MAGIDYSDHRDEESGSQLRRKLEDANKLNRDLEKQLRKELTGRVLTNLPLVSDSDLADVPLDEVEARAAQLQEARSKAADSAVKDRLKAKGLTDEEVEAFLTADAEVDEESAAAAAISKIRSLTSVEGTPLAVAAADLPPGLPKIEFALKEAERRQSLGKR